MSRRLDERVPHVDDHDQVQVGESSTEWADVERRRPDHDAAALVDHGAAERHQIGHVVGVDVLVRHGHGEQARPQRRLGVPVTTTSHAHVNRKTKTHFSFNRNHLAFS